KIEEVSIRQARANGLAQPNGVLLHDVSSGSAADRGGLRRGDIVIAIEGRSVTATNELQREVARYRPGDQIAVDVLRRGERHRFEIELLGRDDPSYAEWVDELSEDDRPPEMPDLAPEEEWPGSVELSDWGIGFREMGDRDAHVFSSEGAYVAYVRRGTAASDAGLPRDVVITHADGEPVTSIEGAVRYLRDASDLDEAVLFQVRRRDGLVAFYEVEVPGR
ncbi:MAG TPA: PDZ domain-containing protein, partial [Rhodothermales bacterium]